MIFRSRKDKKSRLALVETEGNKITLTYGTEPMSTLITYNTSRGWRVQTTFVKGDAQPADEE